MTADTFGPTTRPPARCCGCGRETSGATTYHVGDEDRPVRYCPGCSSLLERHDIDPEQHDQYELLEAIHE